MIILVVYTKIIFLVLLTIDTFGFRLINWGIMQAISYFKNWYKQAFSDMKPLHAFVFKIATVFIFIVLIAGVIAVFRRLLTGYF
ncbi:hypothetical protein ABN763_16710 [Spongiivirga sp. MCCC 1A20706]